MTDTLGTRASSRRERAKFMLDTNIVSFLLRNNEHVKAHLRTHKPQEIALSSTTKAELLYGLAKRPEATRLHDAVHVLLGTFDILPWHTDIAGYYGRLRADLENEGISLSDLNMLIASHALAGQMKEQASREFECKRNLTLPFNVRQLTCEALIPSILMAKRVF